MANLIKNCRLRLGSCFNKFIVDQTNERDIRSLMASLHPLSYDKELIRLGSGRDGGYLVPDDLAGIAACFSPGVADSSSLEFYCADLGMDVSVYVGTGVRAGVGVGVFVPCSRYH